MSDIWPTVPAGTAPASPRPRRRRAGAVPALVAAVAVVAALAGLAVHQAGTFFVFSPGTAPVITTSASCRLDQGSLSLPGGSPCVRLEVPAHRAHRSTGRLLMVDVEVGQASPLQWAEYELGLLGREREMVPVAAYAGNTPASELGCQDAQQMSSANENAALAALQALHYPVGGRELGAQVVGVLAGSPAWEAGVKCNDLITAVDGQPVRTAASLTRYLANLAPGTRVTLTDRPGGTRRAQEVRVTLAAPPAKLVAQGFSDRSFLGVETQTDLRPVLPFPVSVNAGSIGGPSAGLAFTLAILDSLGNGNLTGGHRVAATGTISPDGAVGQVGGVREKTVAVRQAGAQIFFVPAAEYSQAEPLAGKSLRVVPVASLAQALAVLQHRFGGSPLPRH